MTAVNSACLAGTPSYIFPTQPRISSALWLRAYASAFVKGRSLIGVPTAKQRKVYTCYDRGNKVYPFLAESYDRGIKVYPFLAACYDRGVEVYPFLAAC